MQAAVGQHGGAELGQHPVLLRAAAAGAGHCCRHAGCCLTASPGVLLLKGLGAHSVIIGGSLSFATTVL